MAVRSVGAGAEWSRLPKFARANDRRRAVDRSRTYADPKRPIFAPTASESRNGNGIIEYHWTPSDDGRYAVVEFVARDRKALAAILKDARTIKAFEKGKDKKDDITLEGGKKP